MRVFVVLAICSGAILGQAAVADPAQTNTPAIPSTSAQTVAPAVAGTATPPQSAAVAASPASAIAASTATAESDQSGNSGVNLDEVVCKNSEPATGTRLGGGRECHTVREWNQREKEAQDLTRQQQRVGFATKGK
jgi:hypothetical protein